MEVAMVEAVLVSRYGRMDGYSEADGFGDRWDLVGKSEVFIKYEAEVSSRVGGGERGVVDFGKLFAETNEQKFSLGGVQT